jgi:hypothetical protein
MKSYGVNWFLVWISWLIFLGPLFAWVDLFLFSHWHSLHESHELAVAQAFGQPFCWTFFFYFIYEKTLSDPKAIERVRQSLQRSKAARHRRYRWLLTWAVVFALVGIASTIIRLIFGKPSWLYVVIYSLLVPCSCLACFWMIDKATRKGQLEQILKESAEEAP